jgi:hypothetical protein
MPEKTMNAPLDISDESTRLYRLLTWDQAAHRMPAAGSSGLCRSLFGFQLPALWRREIPDVLAISAVGLWDGLPDYQLTTPATVWLAAIGLVKILYLLSELTPGRYAASRAVAAGAATSTVGVGTGQVVELAAYVSGAATGFLSPLAILPSALKCLLIKL